MSDHGGKGTVSVDVHPAVKAIDDMMEEYGGQWPPRPSFENWPPSWNVYQEIADDMRAVCHDMNDAQKFRQWMEQQFEEKVDLTAVMSEVRSRMSAADPVFLGFLAPLSYMTNLYRWGTIPPTDRERMRTTLHFPEALWTPFSTINDFWHLVQRGTTFGLNVCNCCFEDPNNPDKPTDMRFYFNYDPEIVRSEKNFFMSFLDMENVFRPALLAVREYLNETEAARKSTDYAREVLEHRIELLSDIRKQLLKVSRVFTNYMKNRLVSQELWADYVQALPAWNMNGIDGGASGGESLTFHCMDEFLGTLGDGVIFKGGLKKRQGIPIQYNRVLDALHDNGHEYRFCSFLGHPEKEDPVQKAKDEVIQLLYTWRLSHAKVAPAYLRKSRMTSGGSVDKVLINGETLATRGEFELRERARETAAFLTTRNAPRVVQKHMEMMKDGTREHELEELLQKAGNKNSGIDNQGSDNPAVPNNQFYRVYDGLHHLVSSILSKLVWWY